MSQTLKAIVVEDDGVVAESLACTLRDLGHEVCGVAADVLDMTSLLQAHRPDVVVLDLNLGKLHEGVGVATALQAAGPIPIVFIANAVTEDQRKDIRALDAAALVLQPVTPETLRIGIALAVKRSQDAQV